MRIIGLLCLLTIGVFAQAQDAQQGQDAQKDTQTAAAESPAMKNARHSFMLVSTRAVALFHTADSIEARLEAQGSTLRPSTTALRLRIEHALDQAEGALNKGDAAKANEQTKLAGELSDRFARRIGDE